MTESRIWQAIASELALDRHCTLLVVAESLGSAPGKTGALMAVTADGPLAGTIGGGRIEYDLVNQAMTALQSRSLKPELVIRQHRPGAADSSGMVCGGRQSVAIAFLSPGHREAVDRLLAALRDGRSAGWMIGPEGWSLSASPPGLVRERDHWRYHHRAGQRITVWLVGGGHVSLALSRLLSWLDFRVMVLEERPGIASFTGNTFAAERFSGPYEELLAGLPVTDADYAVIMTHSHERDSVALDRLGGRTLGYLGLLGSAAKLCRLLEGRSRPESLRAPAGLPIHSHSPEEIAVSIAAEMIRQRHGGKT